MKKLRNAFVLGFAVMLLASACFNPMADAPAKLTDFATWFDTERSVTTEEECSDGSLAFTVRGNIYACPSNVETITSAPLPSAPGSVEIVPVEAITVANDGRTYFNACTSVGLDDDITALKNNGQVVPNSFMFLDKNETEVAAGDYWFIDVPENVYGHIFYPITGLTYQVRGPAKLMVSAATFWCDNGGPTPHDGMYQMVDAKKLADMLLDANWELAGDGAIGAWVVVPSVESQPK
ncbi:MAG: hypothetical protein UX08_C0024G0004 [Candidatus Collierbacteria bacterium GW2011_GWB1_45_35]|uniref:Lipoprotein n=2 Tax=Candidatus Collieribacteriota TaxID=1752725 RepID=A0A0G1KQS8_9BACT|nr:MAG: hypothetical protein UW48_C0021G0004 [Microgenomates group bacterium GW2011_GWC1_44_23]KKT85835.1 MAG: hypothetical protein UW84_C0021G0004 [Candidatus Collierbacteria bacterium GW2011_GWA2_44_99]KKT94618.1 MAG: hypothetical protein UW96_C0018G0005 [Candidatus Collierbacteria bacterium GW2011_GWA1_45_15]KKT99403.1 MAG: hypothetical protein UX01_C0010G0035 [Candidatus Collierbacteria bacterium GW2011_GWB2_45_17]KKU04503.1 MAG: hypothetical protein UX08_C0024G0004 [Candidatus Collierbacte